MCYSNSSTSQLQAFKDKYNKTVAQPELLHPIFFASGFTFPQWPIVSNRPQIEFMQWGLLPSWLRDQDPKTFATNTLNAKSETILEKASFKHLVATQRCLVPSTGFFEYQTIAKEKRPYFIYSEKEPLFSMAGLYDIWLNPANGNQVHTFTILTCEANPLLAEIHNEKKRMPVILPQSSENLWLETGDLNLLAPVESDFLKAHRIDKQYVNQNDPRVQLPFDPPPTLVQGSLF